MKELTVILMVAAGALGYGIEVWGTDTHGQFAVPEGDDFVQVASGQEALHVVALRSDGTVEAWGRNNYGQCDVPEGISAVQVAAGTDFSVALLANGSVVVWGRDADGVKTVPAPNSGFVEVSASHRHIVALRSDGTVEAWGWDADGQCSEIPESFPYGVTGIDAGYWTSAVYFSNGSAGVYGCDALSGSSAPPTSNIGQMAMSYYFGGFVNSVSGAIEFWGSGYPQIPGEVENSDFASLSIGNPSLPVVAAVRENGTAAVWGNNTYGQCSVPSGFSFAGRMAVGYRTVAALVVDPLGVEDGAFAGLPVVSMAAFPNPSQGAVTLTPGFSDGEVAVYDVCGRVVCSASFSRGEDVHFGIVEPGAYFAVASGSDGSRSCARFAVVR